MTTHTGTDSHIERTDLFIDGDWQPPLSTETYTVVSPATEEAIGRGPNGSRSTSAPDARTRPLSSVVAGRPHSSQKWTALSPERIAPRLSLF